MTSERFAYVLEPQGFRRCRLLSLTMLEGNGASLGKIAGWDEWQRVSLDDWNLGSQRKTASVNQQNKSDFLVLCNFRLRSLSERVNLFALNISLGRWFNRD